MYGVSPRRPKFYVTKVYNEKCWSRIRLSYVAHPGDPPKKKNIYIYIDINIYISV